jgi:hypothetical protein
MIKQELMMGMIKQECPRCATVMRRCVVVAWLTLPAGFRCATCSYVALRSLPMIPSKAGVACPGAHPRGCGAGIRRALVIAAASAASTPSAAGGGAGGRAASVSAEAERCGGGGGDRALPRPTRRRRRWRRDGGGSARACARHQPARAVHSCRHVWRRRRARGVSGRGARCALPLPPGWRRWR